MAAELVGLYLSASSQVKISITKDRKLMFEEQGGRERKY